MRACGCRISTLWIMGTGPARAVPAGNVEKGSALLPLPKADAVSRYASYTDLSGCAAFAAPSGVVRGRRLAGLMSLLCSCSDGVREAALDRIVSGVPEDFDGIVCVGEDEYERYKAKHPHVMFLPNGVDCAQFATTQPPNHLTTIPPNHLTILCVARIDRQKNQMALVEAVARHPGMELRLVGPVTQPDYDEDLKRRARELGVADRVAFVGALKPGSPELIAEYARADAFALASRHEPFGIVVLEAWAAGLPVLASDVGGLGKLCAAHPDAAITFASGDSAALDRAVGELSGRADSGTLGAMSAAGRKAAAEYDWRTLSSRLVDFYADSAKCLRRV